MIAQLLTAFIQSVAAFFFKHLFNWVWTLFVWARKKWWKDFQNHENQEKSE